MAETATPRGDEATATSASVSARRVRTSRCRYGYDGPASLDWLAGVLLEYHGELGDIGNTAITIDRTGQFFFQSPSSGCVGNGTVTPHLDGRYNVYDIELSIENCGATHAHLNGAFHGLASFDSYDYMTIWLIMWLSTTDGAPNRVALNLWARRFSRRKERAWERAASSSFSITSASLLLT